MTHTLSWNHYSGTTSMHCLQELLDWPFDTITSRSTLTLDPLVPGGILLLRQICKCIVQKDITRSRNWFSNENQRKITINLDLFSSLCRSLMFHIYSKGGTWRAARFFLGFMWGNVVIIKGTKFRLFGLCSTLWFINIYSLIM